MTCRRIRGVAGTVLVAAFAFLSASCGDTVRQGQAPAYLVIDNLLGGSGAEPEEMAHVLESDVITNVKVTVGADTVWVPTFFEDPGELEAHIEMKDIGTSLNPNEPSSNNLITVDRYHVRYVRADGRNTPGVDVPYPFDGAATGTFGKSSSSVGFVLVRAQAKMEAPLLALQNLGGAHIISTIAEVTFYGRDQTGNAVSVTGQISVNFADWGDPQ